MMPIENLTNIYRPVRAGKVHLGIKAKSSRACRCVKNRKADPKCQICAGGGYVLYPKEVDYFVLRDAPELIEFYPKNPKELKVSFPSIRFEARDEKNPIDAYMEKVFPQYLKRYRRRGLLCKGNGRMATCVNDDGVMEERECPCEYLEKGECKRIGIFRFRDRHIVSFNVYQITTSSFNSIVNLNSFTRDLVEYCAVNNVDPSMIKLVLRRQEQTIQHMDGKETKTSRHYILQLDIDREAYESLEDVATKAMALPRGAIRELPPAEEDKDDLFFPEEEAEKAQKENDSQDGEIEDMIALCNENGLDDVWEQYGYVGCRELILHYAGIFNGLGGTVNQKSIDKINAMTTLDDLREPYLYYTTEINKLQEALSKENDDKNGGHK